LPGANAFVSHVLNLVLLTFHIAIDGVRTSYAGRTYMVWYGRAYKHMRGYIPIRYL